MKTKKVKLLVVLVMILLSMIVFNSNTVNATGDEIVNIKDNKLKTELLTYDTNKDGELSESEMQNITYLYADSKGITDLTGLEYARNLEDILLGDNNITDISALSELTSLERLYLNNNNITNISALSKLTALKFLDLDNNKISDISVISNLKNLVEIRMSNNKIKDITAIANLPKLTSIGCGDNEITDISSIPADRIINSVIILGENLIGSDMDLIGAYVVNNYIDFTKPANKEILDKFMEASEKWKEQGADVLDMVFQYSPQKTKNVNPSQNVTKTDNNTNIKLETTIGIVPENTILEVKPIIEGTTFENIKKVLFNVNKFEIFDITLKSNGVEIQPNGKVKISIPIPEGFDTSKLLIYRVEENGNKVEYKVNVVTIGNVKYAQFETDHFSKYVLAEVEQNSKEKDDTPKTGSINTISYVEILAIISILGIIVLNKKSK